MRVPPPPRGHIARRAALLAALGTAACRVPAIAPEPQLAPMPAAFAPPDARGAGTDTASLGAVQWRTFFEDSTLVALIDSAVGRNPELLATLQEVEMARNEALAIRGRLFPQVSGGLTLGVDKTARFTSDGAGNASTDITPGAKVPEPLTDLGLGFTAGWEVDIRGKIRSQRGAALARYLASVEGTRYVMTALVAEVATTYYELGALDARLAIIRQAIALQQRELEVVRTQKEAAVVSELAVKQFEALLLNARGLEYEALQQVRDAENRMNLLLGRFPQPVPRTPLAPAAESPKALALGLPSQLLANRPDIRQAERELAATRLDVRAARAEFFPEVNLAAGLGLRAFTPRLLFNVPESMAYSLVGDLAAPLLNRQAIRAEFGRATAGQRKALVAYQRSILTGVAEVSTQASAVGNLERLAAFSAQRAATLDAAVGIARDLFTSARANYLEVLTAQRDAIDAKLELVETRLRQRVALTNLYRALGGGWR